MNKNFQDSVAEILINIECVKFSFNSPFTLTSGEKSPVYVDCRKIISFVEERNKIIQHAIDYININKIKFDIIAGGETAGIPYAAFLSDRIKKEMIYIRKKPKGFGKNNQIEGFYKKNQKALLIEDLATDGGSKVVFINALRESGMQVNDILVIFYYNIFDLNKLPIGNMNVKIHSLCTWKNIITNISEKKIISQKQIDELNIFLKNPELWRKKYG